MADSPFTITNLSTGLRIVHRHTPGPVEYFGVAVNAGSRDELPGEEGLAHFVEHTIFKGTQRRRAWHILNCMEAVGGELNAYTTKEETMIYTVFTTGNMRRAVDLVADLVTSSRFPETEIDREREVVADEINSYLDTPAECVFDDFDDLMFAGSSLGHNILGTLESITTFNSEDCRRWLRRNYIVPRMVLFYSGTLSVGKVTSMCERYFEGVPSATTGNSSVRIKPAEVDRFDINRSLDRHQAHTVMGARIPGLYSDNRLALSLLGNVLGGPGMNARLNVELRERRGLVYSVDTSTSLYTDAGELMIYFGCDPADTAKCRRIVKHTLDNIATNALSPRQLAAAKKQYIGQQVIASQNAEQLILSAARATLQNLTLRDSRALARDIEAITVDKVAECATLLSSNKFSTLTLS